MFALPIKYLSCLALTLALLLSSDSAISDEPSDIRAADRQAVLSVRSNDDLAFAQFVDLSLLPRAFETQDTELLTDLVLQFNAAEKSLGRQHLGISGDALVLLAAELVTQADDETNLQRLLHAGASRGEELVAQIQAIKKLNAQSRASLAPKTAWDSITSDDLAAYESVMSDLQRAAMAGDTELIDSIEESISLMDFISSQDQSVVQSRVDDARLRARSANPEVADLFVQLQGSSRGIGNVAKAVQGTLKDLDPTNPQGTAGHVWDESQGNSSVKVYFKNNSPYTVSIAWSLRPSSGTWYPNNSVWGWAIVPPGSTRYAGNNWGRKFYWCATATTHRNQRLSKPLWWSGSNMQKLEVRSLFSPGFRYVDLGQSWRRMGDYTLDISASR